MLINHHFNEEAMKQEIEDYLNTITKKGEDYGWNVVEKKGLLLT
jgi:hypothetical protein